MSDVQGSSGKHKMLHQVDRLGLSHLSLHMTASIVSCGSAKPCILRGLLFAKADSAELVRVKALVKCPDGARARESYVLLELWSSCCSSFNSDAI